MTPNTVFRRVQNALRKISANGANANPDHGDMMDMYVEGVIHLRHLLHTTRVVEASVRGCVGRHPCRPRVWTHVEGSCSTEHTIHGIEQNKMRRRKNQ
jgi:hypothetical protein